MTDGNDAGRYLILGTIDGLLAVLGIIMGLAVTTPHTEIIVKAALGGGLALCLTNGIGSYLAETAVEYGRISSVERAMLEDLRDTHIEKTARRKIVRDSLISGVSSLIGSVIPIVPFLVLSGVPAIATSVAISALTLIGLGLFSSHVSGQSAFWSVVRMFGLGALIFVVCTAVGLIVGITYV
ncbi:MAG TPA: VIT1/CCC1 transporter family protein [Methanocella sp.]|nr:VIT1/CCC1 transporter family protein [Methanocella sp.]